MFMPVSAPPTFGFTLPPANSLPAPLADAPLRCALDASDDAIVLSDRLRNVVYVNAGFTRLFGFGPEEVL